MSVDHVEVYRDAAGEWRWRAVAGNGEIVATGESHGSSRDAARAAWGVVGDNVKLAIVEEEEEPVTETETEPELEPQPEAPADATEGPEPTEGPVEE